MASFQQVQAEAPHSRVAAWSTSWLGFLQASPSAEVSKVTEDLIWEVLERELSEAPNEGVRTFWSDRAQRVGILTDKRLSPDQISILEGKDQATVHALRKRLREREQIILERDRQLAVLSRQLGDLKRIDQETLTKRRSMHSSR